MSNDARLPPLRVPSQRLAAWTTAAAEHGISLSEYVRRGADAMLWLRRLRFEASKRALSVIEAGILMEMDPSLDHDDLVRSPAKRKK